MIKIDNVSFWEVRIPMAHGFRHALAMRTHASAIVVRVDAGGDIRGHGECTPREYVSGETVAGTLQSLRETGEQLAGLTFETAADIFETLDRLSSPASNGRLRGLTGNARCALELALLDAWGRERHCSLAELLGPLRRERLTYSAALPLDEPAKFTELLTLMKPMGFRSLKLKVGRDLENDLANVRRIREVLGRDAAIRIDANAAWDLKQAVASIERFVEAGVHSVEQPMPAERREDYPRLVRTVGGEIDICIDESLVRAEDARWFIDHRGATAFNLKVSKHGGLANSLKIAALAREAGVHCQLGCHVGETSILTAAGMLLAGLAGDMVDHEGAFGEYVLCFDITRQPLQFGLGGEMPLDRWMDDPGLGVDVDADLLARMITAN